MAKDQELEKLNTSLSTIRSTEEFEILLQSGAIPSKLNTVQKLMAVVKTGEEMGLAPMTSINNINVISGRTVVSSAALGAMLKMRNIEYEVTKDYEVDDRDRIITEMKFYFISTVTKSPASRTFSISWGEMEQAGYTDKENWIKYPS